MNGRPFWMPPTVTAEGTWYSQLASGMTPAGTPAPLQVQADGSVTITPRDAARGAFGASFAEGFQPATSWSFAYGLNSRIVVQTTTGGGAITVTSGLATVATAAGANSSALLETRRALRYVNGIGGRHLGACRFDSGEAGSRLEFGLGDVCDFLGFGYLGEVFGIFHRRHGVRELRSLLVEVGSAGAENVTVTLNGVARIIATGGPLSVTGLADLLGGQDWSATAMGAGAGWDAQAVGASVVFLARSAEPLAGVYSLSSSGTSAGSFTQKAGGVVATEDHYAQASWSENICSWLNPQTGNIYGVSYQWLGFGELRFFVEDPSTGLIVVVHRIAFANASVSTSLRNPQLPLRAFAQNTTNATLLRLYTASATGFRESLANTEDTSVTTWCAEATKNGITTEAAVVSLANRVEVNDIASRVRIFLEALSVHCEGAGNNPITVRIKRGATLGGTPAWTSLNADSAALADTAGTTVSNGVLLWSARFTRNSGDRLDLSHLRLVLAPGEVWTISAASATSADVNVSLETREEL